MRCGTGNFLAFLWSDGDGPLQGRVRYENEGRKQVWPIPIQSTLEATILQTRRVVTGLRAEMERCCPENPEPFRVHERLGPMNMFDTVNWLVETGDLVRIGDEIKSARWFDSYIVDEDLL